MHLGVIVLPEHRQADVRRIWAQVEEFGFYHAWTYDHLSWRTLRDQPWYDSGITLAAAAGVTRHLRLGTLVSSPDFRHPVTTAKQAMTLDGITDGRFILGLGAGAGGPDSTVLGRSPLTPAQRTRRFAEFVELSDALLTHPATTWAGTYYQADDARMIPGCVRRPRLPFAIAASAPQGMRLVARHAQMWVTTGMPSPGGHSEEVHIEALRQQALQLEAACQSEGRNPREIRRLVHLSRIARQPYSSEERLTDLLGVCAEMGFTDAVLGYPRSEGVFAGDVSTFERTVMGHASMRGGEQVAK